MLHHPVLAGSTDQSIYLRIVDSTDGTPETAVVYNTSGIDLWYRRVGAAAVSITEASLSALTDAHSDGGFLHVGNGLYRLDLPDAAVAAGSTSVLVGGTVTGMVVLETLVPLVAYNPFDGVRLGLTALPNAAAEAAGGLITRGSGAGQLTVASGLVGVASLAADSVSASALATDAVAELVAAILAGTVEGSTTVVQALRLALATLGGKADGLATTTVHYRDLADTKNRVTATVDADGNRTAVTLDLT